jgi:peptidoglycan/LPS O-acetylase OafA/YrhL
MKIKYRPEIDGLRTISVFAVIIYHANFILFGHTFFGGGFIGVDIFFVISGYLITTLILKEIYKTNQFSFKYFYERRIRRILPVLLFVIIITSIISYFILLPSSLLDFGKSILSITTFSSNFYFWLTGKKYGEESELLKPLLHTWSLSIEEQFYILFPIFLIIIIKFFRKQLLTILFLTFLVSLFFSEYFSKNHSSFNFYMIFSRGFELLVGSLLSYFELNKGKMLKKSYSIVELIFPSIGVILILYSFLYFNINKIFHPSVATLIPVTGVSLIILFAKKEQLITRILASKVFVFFGLISYSLYLWHYPIFAFLRYVDVFNSSIWIKILAVLLTIMLSVFSYYFIERPFRNKNIISIKTLNTYILISVGILLSYVFFIIKTEGIKNRFPNIFSAELSHKTFANKDKDYSTILKYDNIKYNVFLIGDSHAESLQFILNKRLKEINYNLFSFITSDAYLYIQNFQQIDLKNNINEKYIQKNKDIEKFLSKEKGLVIIHQRWINQMFERINYVPVGISILSKELQEKYLLIGIRSSIQIILNQGHAVILVYPVPELAFNVPRKLYLESHLSIFNKNIFVLWNFMDFRPHRIFFYKEL